MTNDINPAHIEELAQLKELWQKYGRAITTGTSIAIAAILVIIVYNNRSTGSVQKASEMLMTANTIQDLENTITKYPEAPSTVIARLQLAKAYFNSGNYDMSLYKYTEFEQKFPTHQFIAVAKLGKINCMEARGETPDALLAYDNFLNEYPNHYLTSQAILGRARCNEELGKLEEAKAIYEGFIKTFPNDKWIPTAKEALDYLNRKIKTQSQEPVPAAADVK